MITFLYLAMLGLTTWNLSSLLVREDGPWMIFSRIRHRAGVRVSPDGQVVYSENHFAEVFICIWCMSRWVALAIALLFYFFPVFTAYVCIVLSLSTIAILVDRWT